jgi:hypothetical protein
MIYNTKCERKAENENEEPRLISKAKLSFILAAPASLTLSKSA